MLGVLACRAPEPEAARAAELVPSASASLPEPGLGEPALHGCHVFVDAGRWRCLMSGPGIVSVWFPGRTRGGLQASLDGERLQAKELLDRDGVMLRIELPRPRGELRVSLDDSPARSWSLELAPLASAYTQLLDRVAALAGEGQLAAAQQQLGEAASTLPKHEAQLSRCLAARLAYAGGELDRVDAILRELADTPAAGCLGAALLLAAHARVNDAPDFNAAQQLLDRVQAVRGLDFEGLSNAIYQRGVLDHRLGRIDESLDAFERAARLAGLVEDRGLLGAARIMQAVALARLGRFDEAEQLAHEVEGGLEHEDVSRELASDIRYDVGWIALLRRENDPSAADPSPTLERLLADYRARGETKDEAGARLHLALAATQTGAFARAQAQLDALDRELLDRVELVWFELIAAQVAVARGAFVEAGGRLDRAALLAELSEDLELEWRVVATRAGLERARGRGRQDAALAAFTRAGQLADQLALSVPGSAGRSMVVTAHSRVDAEHIELLFDAGRSEAALCVAASVRARHLRSLWARLRPSLDEASEREYQRLLSSYEARQQAISAALDDTWSMTTIELGQLRDRLAGEGERADELLERATALLERAAPRWSCERILPTRSSSALLTMAADSERRRWHFMLARGSSSDRRVERVSLNADAPVELLASRALAQLEGALEGVETLTVIPIAAFVRVDFHQLTLARPELSGLTVRYSLGLGGAGAEAEADADAGPGWRAAVIAGAEDLDAVTREVALVTAQLRARAWVVESQWSPSAEQPTLLHYSGHGHQAGLAGWRSHIEVPPLGRVSAAQIVAAQHAPRLVVLGACSAGSSNDEIIDGGMNLAAAFLLAGASLVIAPSGPVDDETALALAAQLYGGLVGPDVAVLVDALTAAQRAELEAGPLAPGPRSALRWRAWTP